MNPKQKAFEDAVLEWHRWLDSQPRHRAALRRAGSLVEVRSASAGLPYVLLHVRLKKAKLSLNRERVSILAGLLAFLNPERPPSEDPAEANGSDDEKEPEQPRAPGSARSLGRFLAGGGSKPGLTELRFRRLHAVEDRDYEELFLRLGRVVRAYRRERKESGLRPLDVAHTAYYWNDITRENLALGYYPAVLHLEEKNDETTASTTLA